LLKRLVSKGLELIVITRQAEIVSPDFERVGGYLGDVGSENIWQ
jgi:hypothetical protein